MWNIPQMKVNRTHGTVKAESAVAHAELNMWLMGQLQLEIVQNYEQEESGTGKVRNRSEIWCAEQDEVTFPQAMCGLIAAITLG